MEIYDRFDELEDNLGKQISEVKVSSEDKNIEIEKLIKTVKDMVLTLRLDVDERRREVDETLATIRHAVAAVDSNLERKNVEGARAEAKAEESRERPAKVTRKSMLHLAWGLQCALASMTERPTSP
jgi:hypothetical protein